MLVKILPQELKMRATFQVDACFVHFPIRVLDVTVCMCVIHVCETLHVVVINVLSRVIILRWREGLGA